MKMKKLIMAALLAVAGTTLVGTASAQTFLNGDLLVDFRLTSGSGTSGTDLEVDLGSASTFNFSANQTLSQLNVADLSSLYGGSSWNTNSSLAWSVVGANGSSDLFLSDPGNANTVTPPIGSTSGDASTIASLYAESTGTVSPNSSSSFYVAPTDANSYASVIRNVNSAGGQYPADYNFVSFEPSTEQGVSPSGSSVDLYELLPAAGTKTHPIPASDVDLGTFTLGGNGALTFTAAAVPEPSTYVLMGVGVVMLVLVARRRTMNV